MNRRISALGRAVLAAALAAASLVVHFQELSIALSAPISSLDPHFHNLSPNNGMSKHFFDPLVKQDEQQALKPGLAESWRALDGTTWEFKLRNSFPPRAAFRLSLPPALSACHRALRARGAGIA